MNNFIFIVVCFFTILPLTTFLHELGHFFCAKFLIVKKTTLTIGSGKQLLKLQYNESLLLVNILPFGGTMQYEIDQGNRLIAEKRAIISLGGPFLNGFVAFALIIPGFGEGDHFITAWFQWFALFNLWMFVFNILPFKVGKYYTDGWSFLKALKK